MGISHLFDGVSTMWRALVPGAPHFVHDYNRLVLLLRLRRSRAQAMSEAVGGDFAKIGDAERDLLFRYGLRDGMTLVDVGCGSGRLAYALRNAPVAYIGTDVVPALLRNARMICDRPDWHFLAVSGLHIPAADESTDFVTFFSVFTHLLHEESYRYLLEARRVLKRDGVIILSFLDFTLPLHWPIFETTVHSRDQQAHHNQFIDKTALHVWANHLRLDLVTIEDAAIGQSVCVMRRPS
jgi:SAM-dependent methyltransferase